MSVSGFVKSQPLYFRHYEVENGLSHNTVFCVAQDHKGFMWFGTKDGLNRFDGYNFKVYRNKAGDAHSLGSNLINNILIDREGGMWVSTLNGVYKYNNLNESFDLLNFTGGKDAGVIKEDQKGNLWMILNHALVRYERNTWQCTTYQENNTDARNIALDENRNVWISYYGGLKKYDYQQDRFTFYNLFSHSGNEGSKAIAAIYSTENNTLLVGTDQGLKEFYPGTGTYRDLIRYSIDHTDLYVRDIIRNSSNEYWIATEAGIYIYNSSTGKFTNLRKDNTNPYAISDNAVYAMYKDKEGGIWATTYFGGINYFNPQNSFFEKFFPHNVAGNLTGSAVREFTAGLNNQELIIGTEDAGLNVFNLSTLQFKQFNATGSGITSTNIHGLMLSGNDLWVGTFDQGISVVDLKTHQLSRHFIAANKTGALKWNYVEAICKTRSGQIFVGTPKGLYEYHGSDHTFSLVTEVFSDAFVNSILEDHNGTIWVATGSGLYYFNPVTKARGNYTNYNNSAFISGNNVTSVFEDSKRQIWFTTEAGLNKLTAQRTKVIRYTVDNGFPTNFMFKIIEDNQGFLWITTTKGLVRFNSLNNQITVFTTANGLLSDQFNYNSAFKDQAGRLYFGCIKGFIRFDPKLFQPVSQSPHVYFIGFQIDNQEVMLNKGANPLKQSITATKEITLTADQRSFSADFAALSYVAPQSTRYAYKLEGLDKEWTYLKTNRKVYFTKLAPGRYILKVKAANGSGKWYPEEASLAITILPPFYASVWAYILYLSIAGITVYYGFQTYHAKTQQQNKRKINDLENEMGREVYRSKIEFFTNITHEIRTPLTLIKGPLEKAMQSENLVDIRQNLNLMQKSANRLLGLTDQLLDFRRIETEGLKLNFVKINLLIIINDVYQLFKPYAEEHITNYNLILPSAPVYAYVDIEAFNKILSNLINNAVKYAVNFVQIELHDLAAGDHFTIEIKNDGPLIQANNYVNIFKPFFRIDKEQKVGTGLGLPLARSLSEIHNGTLTIVPDKKYNIFALTMPVHQDIEFELFSDTKSAEPISNVVKEQLTDHPDQPVILVVEDNPDIQKFISDSLKETYYILTAANGLQAMDVIKELHIDLIISDVMMPVMDGFEFCKTVKNDIQYSHIPVVLLTAKNAVQSKIEGLEQGADAYMEKPFSPGHLEAQIKNLLSNRKKVIARFAETPEVSMETLGHSNADKSFLDALNKAIATNMHEVNFDIDSLADIMNISRRTLFRKIKAISSLTPNELIAVARLKKAADLMLHDDYKIYEIADMIGFSSAKVFSRAFQKQFGESPSDYAKKIRGQHV